MRYFSGILNFSQNSCCLFSLWSYFSQNVYLFSNNEFRKNADHYLSISRKVPYQNIYIGQTQRNIGIIVNVVDRNKNFALQCFSPPAYRCDKMKNRYIISLIPIFTARFGIITIYSIFLQMVSIRKRSTLQFIFLVNNMKN